MGITEKRYITRRDVVVAIIFRIIQRADVENVSATLFYIVALEWFDGLGSLWVQYLVLTISNWKFI